MVSAINIALSGLAAATKKVAAAASNIANVQTSGALSGDPAPYTPITTTQSATEGGVSSTFAPKTPAFTPAYDPDSPFANEQGVIGVPNVDLAEEAVNLILAKTAYKANIKVIEAAREMDAELLRAVDKKA